MSVKQPIETLLEAQQYVKNGVAQKGGCACPCCGRHCEEYRYSMVPMLTESLFKLYMAGEPLHLRDFCRPRNGGYASCILKNFGLIEQDPSDQKPFNRSGIWSITSLGKRWIKGEVSIPKFIFVFDNKVSGVSEERWYWKEAVKTEFTPEDARQETPGEVQL